MLGRLVAKLLLKACVPLVAVAGVMTYGVYLKGGDPAGLWKHVAGGAFSKAGDMFSNATDRTAGFAGQLAGKADLKAGATSSQVFTWKDAQGVTHFGTSAPADVDAQTMTVDPNVNVLTPVSAPAPRIVDREGREGREGLAFDSPAHQKTGSNTRETAQAVRGGSSQAVQNLEEELGEPLPGVAGQILSNGGGDGAINTNQLIRMLQAGNQ